MCALMMARRRIISGCGGIKSEENCWIIYINITVKLGFMSKCDILNMVDLLYKINVNNDL